MTLYEFNILTLEEKQATVWDIGVFLDNYITEDIRINCYAIKNLLLTKFNFYETSSNCHNN